MENHQDNKFAVDFTKYSSLYECPVWWQNFIDDYEKTLYSVDRISPDQRLKEINEILAKYHGSIVIRNNSYPAVLNTLVFDTEEDYNHFRLYWTLYGQQASNNNA